MKQRQNNGSSQRRLWLGDKPTRKVKANVIFQGDNLEIMRELEPSKIQLIYIDPPFCANNVFKSKAWGKKVVSFNDEWGGGVQSYIRWLVPRLRECYRLLSPTGVFCLHLDQRSSHYARVELDKIFGEKNFVNEIIWGYSNSGRASKGFCKKHDTILVYSKTKEFFWNDYKIPVSKKYLKSHYRQKDKDGKVCRIRTDAGKQRVYYPKEGVSCNDWWVDIPSVNSMAKERVGYPTQKPLTLLDRFIEAFTKKNDMVFDAFSGCGTTISSAQNLGRQWLGIDISKDAISVIRQRMAKEHSLKVQVIKIGTLSRDEVYRLNPFEFEHKMVKMIGGTPNLKKVGDGGIDGFCYDHTPIQVKMSFNVGRPVLDSFYKHVKNGNGRGVIIARSFSSGAYEEVNKLFNEEGLIIDLVPSDDIIRDAS